MIRHSSSFFLSLVFHFIILLLLLFVWKNIPEIKEVNCEKKVCVKLCKVVYETPVIKPVEKLKPIPKPIPKPKPKPKPKIKAKPKPKAVAKKVVIVKEKPIEEPEVVEEVIIQEIKEELEPIQESLATKIIEDVKITDVDVVKVTVEEEYVNLHVAEIARLLQDNLYYPRRARKRGAVGEVMVSFKLSTDAEVSDIKVISSESDILSRAAMKTIDNISYMFPKPTQDIVLIVPINYSLK